VFFVACTIVPVPFAGADEFTGRAIALCRVAWVACYRLRFMLVVTLAWTLMITASAASERPAESLCFPRVAW